MFVRYATTLPTLSVTPHPTSYRVGQGDRLSLQSLVFRIRLFEILGSVGRQVLGEAKGVSASGRVCTKSVQVFADILRFVLLQTRTPSHSTSQPRNTCKPRGPRPSTVKSFRPSSFLYMANLQTVFFDVQQAVRAAEQAHEQLASEGNLPSWPCGANPGYILRGAIVALQNGVLGVVAPSTTPSEIRVLSLASQANSNTPSTRLEMWLVDELAFHFRIAACSAHGGHGCDAFLSERPRNSVIAVA